MRTRLILVAVLSIFLTGCGTATGLIDPENLYPKALTDCANEPVPVPRPGPNLPRSDHDKATFTKDVLAAYHDCHDTVGSWAERRSKYVKQYEKEKYGYVERLWRSLSGADQSD